MTEPNTRYRKVDVYNLHEGDIVWSHQGTDAPYPWSQAGCVSHGKDIYLAGGKLTDEEVKYVSKYNTELSSWETLTDMTEARGEAPAVFVLGGRLYVASGNGRESMESLDISNVSSGWQAEAVQLPFNIAYSQGAVVQDRIYIFGGLIPKYMKKASSWSPGDSGWTSLPDMSISRYKHCTVTDAEDTIWVLGGCWLEECWESGFIEQYTVSTNTWQQLTKTPDMDKSYRDRVNFCVFWKGFIYATFYKWDSPTKTNYLNPTVYIFDTVARHWNTSSTTLKTKATGVMAALM